MLTKNDIRTLANVVIVNPTRADLLPQSCATQRFVASNPASSSQGKELSQSTPN
jgi:hypothetical protein